MTADETGSYLKTTADGNVDLAATCKTLMSAMNGMEKSQKVALLTAIVGKMLLQVYWQCYHKAKVLGMNYQIL